MMKFVCGVTVYLFCIIATGCSTYAIPRYATSADNLSALRKIKGLPVALGTFVSVGSDVTDTIMCRAAGPVKPPDGVTFAGYIKKALAAELTVAEKYDARSKVVISGDLTTIQFSSDRGEWNMALLLRSSNGRQLSLAEKYSYGFSWMAETACSQTAQAGMSAVQNLIGKAVSDPAFSSLMQSPAAEAVNDLPH